MKRPVHAVRVWRLLKRRPGLSLREIMEATRLGDAAVQQVMQRLRKRGCARSEGSRRYCRWFAIGQCPESLRGTAPGSLAALRDKAYPIEARLANLALANVARGKGGVPRARQVKPVVPELHELQRVWR